MRTNTNTTRRTGIALFAVSALLLGAPASSAEVIGFNRIVRPETSYIVPAGKTLILSMAAALGGDGDLSVRVYLPGATEDDYIKYTATNEINSLSGQIQLLYFEEGTRFQAKPGVTQRSFCLIGRLADTGDLFAQVPADLQSVEGQDEKLLGKVQVASARPTRLEVEKSTDLENFAAMDAEVSKQGGAQYQVAVAKTGEPSMFLRVTGRARPGE